MKDENGNTVLDNVLLLTEGNYYPVPNELLPMLISLLESNNIKLCHCDMEETLSIEGRSDN